MLFLGKGWPTRVHCPTNFFFAVITILVVPEVSFMLYHAELTSLVCSSVTVLITMRKLKTDPGI